MADYITALRKKPDKAWEVIDVRDELRDYQNEVGGYIESVTLWPGATVLCDEEGRIKDYEENCEICGVDFCGTILIVGVSGEEFCDVPDELINELAGEAGEYFEI